MASIFQANIYFQNATSVDKYSSIHNLKIDDLSHLFHLPINEAAKELDICTSVLKKICRKLGIKRWPHRKIKSLDRIIESITNDQEAESFRKKRELLLKNPNINYSEIISKSKLNSCNNFIQKMNPEKTIKKNSSPQKPQGTLIKIAEWTRKINPEEITIKVVEQNPSPTKQIETETQCPTQVVNEVKVDDLCNSQELMIDDSEPIQQQESVIVEEQPILPSVVERSTVECEEQPILPSIAVFIASCNIEPETAEQDAEFAKILLECRTLVHYGRVF